MSLKWEVLTKEDGEDFFKNTLKCAKKACDHYKQREILEIIMWLLFMNVLHLWSADAPKKIKK